MNAWNDVAPLNHIRSHPATASWGGRIYVFGGGGTRFASLNSVEVYDPRADRWELATPMPTLRSGAVPAVIGDKIYVVGGGFRKDDGKFRFLPTTEIYDPRTDSWQTGPDMTQPHDYPACAVLDDTIYILGGHHPDATEGGPSSDPGFNYCERLVPGGEWQRIADMPTPRFAPMSATWEGRAWAMGGCAYSPEADGVRDFDVIESYDPATDTWGNPPFSMPWPAAAHGVAQDGEHLYIIGGYSGPGIHERAVSLNAASGASRDLPSLGEPRAAMGTVILDGKLYAIGGWKGDGRAVTDRVEALDLSENP